MRPSIFVNKIARDQRPPTALFFVVYISNFFRESMASTKGTLLSQNVSLDTAVICQRIFAGLSPTASIQFTNLRGFIEQSLFYNWIRGTVTEQESQPCYYQPPPPPQCQKIPSQPWWISLLSGTTLYYANITYLTLYYVKWNYVWFTSITWSY